MSDSAVTDEGNSMSTEALAELISRTMRDVPDFPAPGVMFKDITPLLADGEVFGQCVRAMAELGAARDADIIAGVEARGFILAAALAHELNVGMLPVRKAGKLPPPTVKASYQLEYGSAEIEIPTGLLDGKKVFLVDDVLATGGTMAATIGLLQRAGAEVTGLGVLVELSFLHGRDRLTGWDPAALLVL